MGFFSSFFGRRERQSSDTARQPTAELPAYNQLINSIVSPENLQSKLLTDVTRAFEAPQSFYEATEYVLAQRGLTYPQDAALTPKFVFIDTLIDHQQMAEVDWKEAEDEIRAQIRQIMAAKQFPISIASEEQYENKPTHEIIELIDEQELTPIGYSLQVLDIHSDSYVFTIVPLSQAEEIAALFAQLK
jgi:hypothetical protein